LDFDLGIAPPNPVGNVYLNEPLIFVVFTDVLQVQMNRKNQHVHHSYQYIKFFCFWQYHNIAADVHTSLSFGFVVHVARDFQLSKFVNIFTCNFKITSPKKFLRSYPQQRVLHPRASQYLVYILNKSPAKILPHPTSSGTDHYVLASSGSFRGINEIYFLFQFW
jgi:hypothetical protein